MGEWKLDFHWYPEGCWSDPGRGTGFRTMGILFETCRSLPIGSLLTRRF